MQRATSTRIVGVTMVASIAVGGCTFRDIANALGGPSLDYVRSAPVIGNLNVTSVVDPTLPGSRTEPSTLHPPADVATFEQIASSAHLVSYVGGVLCVDFSSERESTSDQPPDDAAVVLQQYRLFAPTTVSDPHESPHVNASSLHTTAFAARFLEKRVSNSGHGEMVERNIYDVKRSWQVCFDDATKLIAGNSQYLYTEYIFQDPSERWDLAYGFAWRFAPPPNAHLASN